MNSILICHCLPIPVFICYVKEVVVFNQDESRLKKVILRHDIFSMESHPQLKVGLSRMC